MKSPRWGTGEEEEEKGVRDRGHRGSGWLVGDVSSLLGGGVYREEPSVREGESESGEEEEEKGERSERQGTPW